MAKIVFLLIAAFAVAITTVQSRPVKKKAENGTVSIRDLQFIGTAAYISSSVRGLSVHNKKL